MWLRIDHFSMNSATSERKELKDCQVHSTGLLKEHQWEIGFCVQLLSILGGPNIESTQKEQCANEQKGSRMCQ